MALFTNWFSRKTSQKATPAAESSGLGQMDPTMLIMPSARRRPAGAEQKPTSNVANRKTVRMERRELLYGVVRDVMVRAEVLSVSYRFKVLSLDSGGRKYIIMMDLMHAMSNQSVWLAEIENKITQSASKLHDITVAAVYWRVKQPVISDGEAIRVRKNQPK